MEKSAAGSALFASGGRSGTRSLVQPHSVAALVAGNGPARGRGGLLGRGGAGLVERPFHSGAPATGLRGVGKRGIRSAWARASFAGAEGVQESDVGSVLRGRHGVESGPGLVHDQRRETDDAGHNAVHLGLVVAE